MEMSKKKTTKNLVLKLAYSNMMHSIRFYFSSLKIINTNEYS